MVTVAEVIDAAEQQSGLTANLEPAVMSALEILTSAMTNEASLNERGQQSMTSTLVRNLVNRMRVEQHIAQNQQILEKPITKPLFVFGLPRTGTTLVINLLNEDPARRCFLRWEALDSVPPPRAAEMATDPRCIQSQKMTELGLKYAPHIAAIHYEEATSPTECQFAMSQSFCAQYYDSMMAIPSYHQWLLHTNYRPAFEYQKRLLQLLQCEAPGRWTLKNPWHPLFLQDLTQVYPDARLVMTHRDPVEVVASACSLVKHVRQTISDEVDLHLLGQQLLETFLLMIERTLEFKKQHGWDAIYDLLYSDMMRDPIKEMKKLYTHLKEPWNTTIEAAMKRHLANNPKGKFGTHEYHLQEYGLDKETIREIFADYCQKFRIPITSKF